MAKDMVMLQIVMDFWFINIVLSLLIVLYAIRKMPVSWVQKLGWILVVAYTGIFGLICYVLTCHSPSRDAHALYTKPIWKQAANSEVHCVAGDATGIIIAAIVLSFFEIPIALELVIEYLAAFISGWFIFQAGMMRSMYDSYSEALFKTFFAETVSMNFVMLGMIPVMVLIMQNIPDGRNPLAPYFWFAMGAATIAGCITAYPINYWLVARKLKHGCMTIPTTAETHSMEMHDMTSHEMGKVAIQKKIAIAVASFVVLAAVVIMVLASR